MSNFVVNPYVIATPSPGSLISEQTVYNQAQNASDYQGWFFKLESALYQSKTLTSVTIKHSNSDGTVTGDVSLKLYPIGSNPWTLGTLIGSMGTKDVPIGTTTENVTFTDAVTVPSAGAWLLLDIAGLTANNNSYHIYGVVPKEDAEPEEYDPWLEEFKYKSDNSISPVNNNWYYSISGY